ncbi:MAG: hypothetical protein ACE5E8_09135 [Acidimicrobiia bacterium]
MNLSDLIEANDPDGLLRHIETLVTSRVWEGIVEVRDRCNEAVGRGKELWGVAAYAEYRLALDAPGEWAAQVLREGTGRHGLGPLWEVAASTHPYLELVGGIADGRMRTLVAAERTLRGEDLSDADGLELDLLGTPVTLASFESHYRPATYRSDRVEAPEPELRTSFGHVECVPGDAGDPDEVTEALYGLVAPWAEQSTGSCLLSAVIGGAGDAFGVLHPGEVRAVDLDASEALALMAWAGASGGTFGRRRGGDVGRSLAWWVVAAAAGFTDQWPLRPRLMEEGLAGLQWIRFDPGPVGGWQLHVAVADRNANRAWAVSAVDRVEGEPA